MNSWFRSAPTLTTAVRPMWLLAPSGIPLGDKFLFGLYRLATGMPLSVCAVTFGLGDTQKASRIFTALVAAWRQVLEMTVICPSPDEMEKLFDIDSGEPDVRNLKLLLDTTEIHVQRSENLELGVSHRTAAALALAR
jgi:hypothetical protein